MALSRGSWVHRRLRLTMWFGRQAGRPITQGTHWFLGLDFIDTCLLVLNECDLRWEVLCINCIQTSYILQAKTWHFRVPVIRAEFALLFKTRDWGGPSYLRSQIDKGRMCLWPEGQLQNKRLSFVKLWEIRGPRNLLSWQLPAISTQRVIVLGIVHQYPTSALDTEA